MPDPRPAQQIGDLLTQSGVPANHSLDIAQRLLTLADSSQTAGGNANSNANSREITASQARSSQFRNQFRSKEQTAEDGEDGRAGKDGLSGYNGTGVDGKDGEQGDSGSAGRDGQVDLTGLSGIIFGLLPGLLDKILTCAWFRKKAQSCLQDISTPPSLPCKPAIEGDIVCCSGNGGASKRSACAQINEISIELRRLRERIDECCGGGDPVRWVCENNVCAQKTVPNNTVGYETEAECRKYCGQIRPPAVFACQTNPQTGERTCIGAPAGLQADGITLFVDLADCKRVCEGVQQRSAEVSKGGPGTELKKLLAGMGYVTTENCPCNARAREMDENGVQWVKDNRETVIGWLEEQAKERSSWIFTRAGAAALIEVACLMAGKDDQSEAGGP